MNEPARTSQEITLRVTQQAGCPVFRRDDKMTIRLPEIDTGSGSVCLYAAAQALPMLAAATRSGQPAENCLKGFRCISGGDHYAEFAVTSSPIVETPETRIEQALRQAPFFSELSRLEMEKIVAKLETDQYFPRSLIVEPGKPADRLIVVTRGICEIVSVEGTGFERVLGRVTEGGLFGASELPTATPTPAGLRCLTIVHAAVLLRDDLTTLMHEDPTLAAHLNAAGFGG